MFLSLLIPFAILAGSVLAIQVPLLQPGFFFDYNIPTQPVPIPITGQCDRIHITWGRRNAIGPNPSAPYMLQVYTSTFIWPFNIDAGSGLSFDWDVPFAPGTQYQICMFDKNGVPGGCQAMYTVVQNSTTSHPSCQNVTTPSILGVSGTVPGGALSQYGFVDQCTDLSVTPLNGTPPFILTVAPSLHPPYNITSNSMDPITWTVSLSWSFPFFLSLVSSEGLVWANGPMHAGGFGPNDCLAPGTVPKDKANEKLAGSIVGSLFAGSILSFLACWLIWKCKYQQRQIPLFESAKFDRDGASMSPDSLNRPLPMVPATLATRDLTGLGLRGLGMNEFIKAGTRQLIQPYDLPPSTPPPTSKVYRPSSFARRTTLPPLLSRSNVPEGVTRSRTYIIHSDAGRYPTDRADSGSGSVFELPPEYNIYSNGEGSRKR